MKLIDILEDPAVFGIRKLPPHFTARRSKEIEFPDGLLSQLHDYALSLDGEWRIHWSPDLDHLPEGFEAPEFDDSNWHEIALPATFEMQGFGTPIYLNSGYPFRKDPPHVMSDPPPEYTAFTERNPTGSCRRVFKLPEKWRGSRLILHCAGVQSAFRVWVNGVFAGYSEDSAGIAEFDVTDLCRPGRNVLAMQVYKYCSGSYLEDQDCWRFSGIFRSVELFALDPKHIRDAVLTADPDTGRISVKAELSAADCTLELRSGNISSGEQASSAVSCTLPEFALWSHEKPVLYPVTLILRDHGRICDIRHFRAGFRKFEIRDRQIFLNGVSIKFRGVNRHEISPKTGRAVTIPEMRRDIELIKEANFNAVRNSHYPQPDVWYELCDLYGLYLMDEANIESHGLSYHACVLPGDDPVWEPAVLDRLNRMVRQNRNHPCILVWSMGNEAGYGNAFEHGSRLIHSLDPRPVHYADMNSAADFDSRTYPTVEWLKTYIAGCPKYAGEHGEVTAARQFTPLPSHKPFVTNEYAHAMGNSTGDLAEYWVMFEAHKELVGGFVWEWCDHTLNQDGITAGAYGGDFGDVPSSDSFCCDGLVSGDRIPHPGWFQMQAVQKPFAFAMAPDGDWLITNKYYFTDFKEIQLFWSLVKDGMTGKTGELQIELPPGRTAKVPPPCPLPDAEHLAWRLRLVQKKIVQGEAEIVVKEPACVLSAAPETVCKDFVFPHITGTPEPVFDRAWNANDNGCHFAETFAAAMKNAQYRLDFFQRDDGIRAELEYTGGEVARIGIRFPVSGLADVEWFGLGPHPTYCDIRDLALTGLWRQKPEKFWIHYARPQENGHICEVRYTVLHFADGRKLRITADRKFGFNVFPMPQKEFSGLRHDHEVRFGNTWELVLDLAQRGVAGDNSWGDQPLDCYRLTAGHYGGSFLFSPA